MYIRTEKYAGLEGTSSQDKDMALISIIVPYSEVSDIVKKLHDIEKEKEKDQPGKNPHRQDVYVCSSCRGNSLKYPNEQMTCNLCGSSSISLQKSSPSLPKKITLKTEGRREKSS